MHTIQFPPGPRLVMRFPLFVSNHNKSKLKLLFAIFSFLCPSLGGSGAQHKGSPWNGRPCTILLQSTRLIFIYNNHLSVDVSEGLANIMNQKVLMKILPIREGKQINGNKTSLFGRKNRRNLTKMLPLPYSLGDKLNQGTLTKA